ncbi:MAG TPA: metallophosphoesterase, partial [Acidimicrobiia bacterium]|nr:metallophosphoesterase [Acidimicrobiia bacterium]
MGRSARLFAVMVVAAAGLAGIPHPVPARAADPVLIAAGDVADCSTPYDEATAALINQEPSATVALLGDGAYPTGDLNSYNQCYGPSWGQFKDRTRPTPGNHDYAAGTHRQSAPGYFDYFGASAGDPNQGFYSYDLGAWHIVSLNANCQAPGAGCTPGSPQLQWLESDLAAHPTQCLATYWHQSRFFSMENHGTEAGPSSDTSMSPIWDVLEAHGADVVVSAHIHLYERFPRQNSAGDLDPNGMREFVVGTGGGHHDTFDPTRIDPHSEFRQDGVFGVLKLTLHGAGYDWAFEGTDGSTVDSGSDSCTPSTGGGGSTPPPTAPPGSTSTTTTAPAAGPGGPHRPRSGYWMLAADGTVYPFGDAATLPGATPTAGTDEVDLEPTPSGDGAWLVDAAGRVTARGDAVHLGDVDRSRLVPGEKVTSLSATPTGAGYWVFTSRGRVIPFGDATSYGDMSGTALNSPVLGSVPTPSGHGYYMVAGDGGIFSFGDARFYGSMGGKHLNAPVQSLVPDGDGQGYWLVASDGGIFAFDAPFQGSMGGTNLNKPVTGMVRFGDGYLMVGADGGIFDFSSQPFSGSLGGHPPARPIVSWSRWRIRSVSSSPRRSQTLSRSFTSARLTSPSSSRSRRADSATLSAAW